LRPDQHTRCYYLGWRWPAEFEGLFLFGEDFNRAYRWIVDSRRKVNFDFALGRGFNMRKGFDQWFGTGFPENIKSSEKHRPVTRNLKHPAAHTPNAAILNAEPMLHKVQLQSVLPAGRNRHYVMEMSKPMPFVKTTIADVGSRVRPLTQILSRSHETRKSPVGPLEIFSLFLNSPATSHR
jgi:hypothetical protein